MSDPRVSAVNQFTPTQHHSVPDDLRPEANTLPATYTVCIIGAGQGIGEHIAYAYAKACVGSIMIAARSLPDLEEVRHSIAAINKGVQVEVATCDIASAESVAALAALVNSLFGRLDVLVCNAGYAGPVTLKMHQGEPEHVQRAFDVNAMGTYHAAHYFIPILLASENGAKGFYAIGSTAGALRRGPIANTGYCVSKMAQIRLVEFLEEQYGNQSIFSIAIHPGAVKTRMAEGNTPEVFLPYLTDGVDLCGAVCVWLSGQHDKLRWLSGRYISANWNMSELVSKRDEVIAKDLLKFGMVMA